MKVMNSKKPGHRTSKGRGQFKKNDRRSAFKYKDNLIDRARKVGIVIKSLVADQTKDT